MHLQATKLMLVSNIKFIVTVVVWYVIPYFDFVNMVYKYMKCVGKGLGAVLTIETIMYTRLVVGLFYSGSSNVVIRLATRLYCALWSAVLILEFCRSLYFAGLFWIGVSSVISFAITISINLIFEGEHLFKFLNKIRKEDNLLRVLIDDEIPFSRIVFLYVISHKLVIFGIVYFLHNPSLILYLSHLTLSLESALCNLTRIIMFELLYRRMKVLRKQFGQNLSAARRFEEGEKVLTQNLKTCMITYKKLTETVQETATPMKLLIFLDVVCAIPKFLIIIYSFIGSPKYSVMTLVTTVLESPMPFLPGILVELTNCEVDMIKLYVVKQLLVCRGANSRAAIQDAVKFFKHHPFKYTIWRILTIDLNLIFTMASLITTYTLAMIQFAHFYN